MDLSLNDELEIIGKNIRKIRKRKGISLSALAEMVNISIPFMSQIENRHVNFNLSDLSLIANALEVSITSFFVSDKPDNVRLIKRKDIIWKPLYGNVIETILMKSLSNFEISMIRIPTKETTGNFNHHEGVELCYVIDGSLQTIFKDHSECELGPGDAVFYLSTIPHKWKNSGDKETEFLLVNSSSVL
jgi:transcriptional regulator with XRE-family HTH domain